MINQNSKIKIFIGICILLVSFDISAQRTTAHILIKQKKAKPWHCLEEDVDYKIHFTKSNTKYSVEQKILKELKKRFLAGNEKDYRIKVKTVYMNINDYLVIYGYHYKPRTKAEKCLKKYNRINAYAVNLPEKTTIKLEERINNMLFPELNSNFHLIEAKQHFKSKSNLFSKPANWLRKYIDENFIDSTKIRKSTAIGVRG